MTARAPPEFRFVAACCRWPLTVPALAAIRAAAVEVRDWPHVLRIVARQRVGGLVHNAVRSAGLDLPPRATAALADEAQRIGRQALLLTAETARLQEAFEGAGVPFVVLKGVPLAQRAYGSVGLKHARDVDVLVPPARAEEALGVLERRGYGLVYPARRLDAVRRRAVIRFGNEFTVQREGQAPLVEMRWRLTDNPRLVAGLDPFARTQDVAMPGGGTLRTLADDDLFAYLCVHGASHAWSRLKWLADVGALIGGCDGAEIERLYRHAEATGGGLCAGQALVLCRRLVDLPLPPALAKELAGGRRLSLLAALALDTMIGPDGVARIEDRRFGSTRVNLMQFLLGRGPAHFFAQCRVNAVRLGDVVDFPLPQPLHFLYLLLRLPLWLWRRVRHLGADTPFYFPTRR